MGGAESIDKQFRTEGVTWFKEEMPTYEEKEYGMINLEKHNFNVVITSYSIHYTKLYEKF